MKRTVGIDIGNYAVKLIELEDKKGSLELARCSVNRIVDSDKKSALRDLLSQSKLPLKRANVSLSGSSVIVRYIEMPPMKKEELKSAIRFEAEKYIPFSINESTIDCAMLDKTASGSQRVLLVGAKKQEISNLLELFKEFGIEVRAIDIDSFAFFNSFQRIKAENKDDSTYGLINMGVRFFNMNIVTKQNLYFTRDILWGGADVTVRVKDALGISLDEAEALKCNPGERKEEMLAIITPTLEKLVLQIRMSFDYFETQFGKNVERLFISGGSSYLFSIVDFLKDNLGVDVLMWNPFEGIALADSFEQARQTPAQFAVAIGLALRR